MNHFKRTKSNDIVDLSILFPNVINKISISSTIQASSNLFKPQKSLSPTATNDSKREATRSNPSLQRAHKPENNYFRINAAASNEGEIDSRLIEHIIQGRRCVFARERVPRNKRPFPIPSFQTPFP